jgi:hypothetical protein
LAHFAPRIQHDDEETTVTRPRARSQVRAALRIQHSIDLDEITEPNRSLPDFSCEEEWLTTNELPRPPYGSERPLPLVKRRPSRAALPPPSAALPPIPRFTHPIAIASPKPPPPAPLVEPSVAEIEVREDLRVDWPQVESVPTTVRRVPAAHVYRPRLPTVRGLELRAMAHPPPAPEAPSVVIHPRAELVSELPRVPPISEVLPCAFAAPTAEPPPARGLPELLRAAKADAWTAFLVLPIAVSLVSIVVLAVSAAVSSSQSAAQAANRRVVSATDATGSVISDATVFVDGAARCQSLPCAFDLEEGTHWVAVSAPGYDAPPVRAVVTGQGGPRQLDFVLTAREPAPATPPPPVVAFSPPPPPEPLPDPAEVVEQAPSRAPPKRPRAEPSVVRPRVVSSGVGLLNINSIPASNVVLDGRPLGRTPKIGVRVAPGPHTVVFIDGKRRVVRGTNVVAGKTAVVAARF